MKPLVKMLEPYAHYSWLTQEKKGFRVRVMLYDLEFDSKDLEKTIEDPRVDSQHGQAKKNPKPTE